MSAAPAVEPSSRDVPAAPLAIAALVLVIAIASKVFPGAYPVPIVALGALAYTS